MTLVSEFRDLMPHSITRKAFLRRSTTGYGGPTYSTVSASYRGRVVATPKRLLRPDGQEVAATHTIWLATTATINPEDQLTYAGSTYRIVAVERQVDEDGMHHVKLFTVGG